MAREFSQSFYASPVWRKVRKSFIAHRVSIDGGICEICKSNVGYIVHHVKHITPSNINDTMITLHYRNLQYLCQECHNRIHMTLDDSPYMFDASGMLIEKPKQLIEQWEDNQ